MNLNPIDDILVTSHRGYRGICFNGSFVRSEQMVMEILKDLCWCRKWAAFVMEVGSHGFELQGHDTGIVLQS